MTVWYVVVWLLTKMNDCYPYLEQFNGWSSFHWNTVLITFQPLNCISEHKPLPRRLLSREPTLTHLRLKLQKPNLKYLVLDQLGEFLESYRWKMLASITTVNLLKLTEKIKLSPLLAVTSKFGQHSFGQEGLWIQMEAEQTLHRRIIHQPQFTAAPGPSQPPQYIFWFWHFEVVSAHNIHLGSGHKSGNEGKLPSH